MTASGRKQTLALHTIMLALGEVTTEKQIPSHQPKDGLSKRSV
jgi:hypothetical protein